MSLIINRNKHDWAVFALRKIGSDMLKTIWLAMIIMALAAASVSADTLYVQSQKAPLWLKPSLGADQLSLINRGEAVQKLKEQGGAGFL
jgi:hypothetical protein